MMVVVYKLGFSLAVNLNPGFILQNADQNCEKFAVFLELFLIDINFKQSY